LLRIIGLLRPYSVRAALSLVLGIAMVVLTTCLPLVLGSTVDHGVVGRQPGALAAGALLFLALALARLACSASRRAIGGALGADVEYDLRNLIAGRVLSLDTGWHDQSVVGQLLARSSSDVGAIRIFIGFGFAFSLLNTLTVAVAITEMWLLSARLTLVTLAFAPLLAAVSLRYNLRARRVFRRVQDRVGLLTTVVEENAAGIKVVRAFGQERTQHATFTREADALLEDNLAATRLRARFGPLLALFPSLSLLAVLWYGCRLVAHRDLTLGALVAVNSYLVLVAAPLQSVSTLSGMAQRALAGAARVFEILDAPVAIADRRDAIALPRLRTGASRGAHVELDGVSFWYQGASRPALTDVRLEIAPGERVALVGDSGSGKSTLAALLTRAIDPASGRVRVDGYETAGLTLASLRATVVVVPADPVLFAATVRHNLTLGVQKATDLQIRSALHTCAALGFADRLPDGLDTMLDHRGVTLSGGQRQRIALARALLARPRVLVLDNALAQLDALTEATVLDRLAERLDGTSVLILAGRHANLRLASRVLTLDAGRLATPARHARTAHAETRP
jgi:ATP-binding cassette subfamily B protein